MNESPKEGGGGGEVGGRFIENVSLIFCQHIESVQEKNEICVFVLQSGKGQESGHFICFSVQFFFLSSLEKVNTLVLIEDYSGHSSTAVLLLGTAVGQ